MQLTYRTDAWWGAGHFIVYAGEHADRCQGRVSKNADGTWSACPEPLYPSEHSPLKAAVASGLPTREAAGEALAEYVRTAPPDPIPVMQNGAVIGYVGDGRFT